MWEGAERWPDSGIGGFLLEGGRGRQRPTTAESPSYKCPKSLRLSCILFLTYSILYLLMCSICFSADLVFLVVFVRQFSTIVANKDLFYFILFYSIHWHRKTSRRCSSSF